MATGTRELYPPETSQLSAEDWERRLATDETGICCNIVVVQALYTKAYENTTDPDIRELINGLSEALDTLNQSTRGNFPTMVNTSLLRQMYRRAYPADTPSDKILSIVPPYVPSEPDMEHLSDYRDTPRKIGQLVAAGA